MYPGIGTHLPGFSQAFDDLSLVGFDFIDLDGADAEISSIFLSARLLSVHSMGGSVIGKFAATRRLDIFVPGTLPFRHMSAMMANLIQPRLEWPLLGGECSAFCP